MEWNLLSTGVFKRFSVLCLVLNWRYTIKASWGIVRLFLVVMIGWEFYVWGEDRGNLGDG